jgi:hypothetical protein
MNVTLKYTLIGLLVLGLVGVTAIGVAYAEGAPPRPHELLADLLGLTPEELHEQFQDGKSLEDLVENAGIDLEELKDTLESAREEIFKTRIQEALDNGDLSEDHANWLSEGLKNGFLGGEGRLGGFGPKGHVFGQNRSESFGEFPHCEDRPQRGNWDNAPHGDQ